MRSTASTGARKWTTPWPAYPLAHIPMRMISLGMGHVVELLSPRAASEGDVTWRDDEHRARLGPGWAWLLVRLDRRLRRRGYDPASLLTHITVTAGDCAIPLPGRAPLAVHRIAAAVARVASRTCEICLRRPARPSRLGDERIVGLAHVCAWHNERMRVVPPWGLRVEAWDAVRDGAGPLRSLLLGARLSPAGLTAAIGQFAAAVPPDDDDERASGWIMPELMAHALSHVPEATLDGVPAAALVPLLGDECADIRAAALRAIAFAGGGAMRLPQATAGPPTEASQCAPAIAVVAPPAVQPTGSGPQGAPRAPDASNVATEARPDSACREQIEAGNDAQVAQVVLPRPSYPLAEGWILRTVGGSEYTVIRDAVDTWWCGGWNTSSSRSAILPPGRLYQVNAPRPWPPVLGQTLRVEAATHLDRNDPGRMPGGGKRLSDVIAVLTLPLPPAAAAADPRAVLEPMATAGDAVAPASNEPGSAQHPAVGESPAGPARVETTTAAGADPDRAGRP